MFKLDLNNSKAKIETLIGAGTVVTGDIRFTGGLRVDGEVNGNVRCVETGDGGHLVVSEKGRIEGEVSVAHAIINGVVNGPINAKEFLALQPRARVLGDVSYNHIELHLGAVIQGRMVKKTEEKDNNIVKLTANK